MKVIVSQTSNPSMPHCTQFSSSQHIGQGNVICINIKCVESWNDHLWPTLNKDILIYEQNILFAALLRIDWYD